VPCYCQATEQDFDMFGCRCIVVCRIMSLSELGAPQGLYFLGPSQSRPGGALECFAHPQTGKGLQGLWVTPCISRMPLERREPTRSVLCWRRPLLACPASILAWRSLLPRSSPSAHASQQHSLIFKRVPIWECLVGTLFACIFRDR
jgi:hypothetical protein